MDNRTCILVLDNLKKTLCNASDFNYKIRIVFDSGESLNIKSSGSVDEMSEAKMGLRLLALKEILVRETDDKNQLFIKELADKF